MWNRGISFEKMTIDEISIGSVVVSTVASGPVFISTDLGVIFLCGVWKEASLPGENACEQRTCKDDCQF